LLGFGLRLLSIAEETLAEFLSKATGTAVDWVQMPGMKVIRISYHYLSVILSVDIYGNM
jgi:hypothetical protein